MIALVCYYVFIDSFSIFHVLLMRVQQFGDLFLHPSMFTAATDRFLLFDSILETTYSVMFDVVRPLWRTKDHHYCLLSVYILFSRVSW